MDTRLGYLTRLRVGQSKAGPAPNKPCLLLAIICEIQSGHVGSPEVVIDKRLLARYHDLYEAATGNRHAANPQLPLWHLRNDQGPNGPLWSPDYVPEMASLSDQLGQPKSLDNLLARFASAHLDAELFAYLQDAHIARQACALLTQRYLSDDPQAFRRLADYLECALASSEYEKAPENLAGVLQESSQQYARSAAFRTLVLDAYDYRCAASRLRYITPDYRYLVEAAHLIPFAVCQDDRPTNGLALTPNLHWAMDNHLIAPGPDHRWHVSPTVDALIEDNQWLWRLDRQPLVLPREERFHPQNDGLAWRMDHLQR